MTRVRVKPELLRWALDRARIHEPERSARFPQVAAWERGERQPTVKQLEAFAKATHTPFGYFFLPEPPDEPLPIADFRERHPGPPSGDLLDTIYAIQRRQDWFKEHATRERLDAVPWVGSATLTSPPAEVAARLRQLLGFEPGQRAELKSWEAGTKALVDRAQALGVLVSVSGVVGSNTQRPLNPQEFRGFALVDPLAPAVFVNGADHKAAHAFTLCHELAHLALGRSGLSNEDLGEYRHEEVEVWCDAVASELLTPSALVTPARAERDVERAVERLTVALRVSPLVAVRRVVERSRLDEGALRRCFGAAFAALPTRPVSSGGDFYATTLKRVGHRLARDVIASALEGDTTFTEAFRLLGVRSSAAFDELARRLEIKP